MKIWSHNYVITLIAILESITMWIIQIFWLTHKQCDPQSDINDLDYVIHSQTWPTSNFYWLSDATSMFYVVHSRPLVRYVPYLSI